MSDDVSPAEWIAPRLTGGFGAVTRTVPCGYPAYARICHPAGARDGGPGYLVGGGPSDRAPDPPGHAVARTRGFSGPPERERVGVARPQPRARELRVLLRRLRRPDQRRLPSRGASHPVSVRRAPAPGRHPRGRQPRDHHRSVRPGAIAATKGQSIGRDVDTSRSPCRRQELVPAPRSLWSGTISNASPRWRWMFAAGPSTRSVILPELGRVGTYWRCSLRPSVSPAGAPSTTPKKTHAPKITT